MENILILVHVEETFRRFFPAMYTQRLIHSCKAQKYCKVIHMTSHINDDQPIDEIMPYVDKSIDWAWGYEPEVFEEDEKEQEWVIESRGHEYTWVPPELRNYNRIKKVKVYLGGGYRTECLADMESVLEHLGVNYELVNGLVY